MRKNYIIILLIFLTLSIIHIPSSVLTDHNMADSPWPCYGGNLQRTGLSPYNTSHLDGSVKWEFKTGDKIRNSPVIGPDGTIYFASDDDNFYAVESDGKKKWSVKIGKDLLGSSIISSPAVGSDGIIYMVSDDSNIYAINDDGTIKWKHYIGDYTTSSPIIYEDTIYIGSYNEKLFALNLDGTEKWVFKTSSPIHDAPTMSHDGSIIFTEGLEFSDGVEDGGIIYSLNQDGKLNWKKDLGSYIDTTPAIDKSGNIYVGTSGKKLFALHSNGTVKWNVSLDSAVSNPSIGKNGNIYVGTGVVSGGNEKFYAISSKGEKLWSHSFDREILSKPSIGSDGTIYATCFDGGVYAFSPNGTLKWSYKTDHPIQSSPVINSDGSMYVGGWDGRLYAFGEKEGKGSPAFKFIYFSSGLVGVAVFYYHKRKRY